MTPSNPVPPRTLADYRPQHDFDCLSLSCAKCGHAMEHHQRGCKSLRKHDGDWPVFCGCAGESYACSCGLSALLVPPVVETAQETDSCAELIGENNTGHGDTLPRPSKARVVHTMELDGTITRELFGEIEQCYEVLRHIEGGPREPRR